jgi:WD40 repeat protein
MLDHTGVLQIQKLGGKTHCTRRAGGYGVSLASYDNNVLVCSQSRVEILLLCSNQLEDEVEISVMGVGVHHEAIAMAVAGKCVYVIHKDDHTLTVHDGSRNATNEDGTVTFVTSTHRCLHRDPTVAISATSTRLITISRDGTACVWNTQSLSKQHVISVTNQMFGKVCACVVNGDCVYLGTKSGMRILNPIFQ